MCISNRGNSYLTYNEDFNGIIVSDIEGRVVLCFRFPGDYTVKDRYYYNEKKQYLYIIKDCELYVYSIQQDDKLIDEMNKRYYMAECGRKSLQNDLEFEELFHEVLDTAECKLMLNIKLV